MNFLERLIAEWYQHQGYLVRTNVCYGRPKNGGYEGEMDIVALELKTRKLVHLEVSSDADSWAVRIDRIRKKFQRATEHYAEVFGEDFGVPQRIAIGPGRRPKLNPLEGEGIEIRSFNDLMGDIKRDIELVPNGTAIPEVYGYLRAIQFALLFGNSSDVQPAVTAEAMKL